MHTPVNNEMFHKSNDRYIHGTENISRSEKIVVRSDSNESNNVWALMVENCSIVSRYVNASATCIWVMQEMIV